MSAPRIETGSFRDRTSRVFYWEGRVCRYLDEAALSEWDALSRTAFFPRLMAEGRISATRRLTDPAPSISAPWKAVLEHERLPFVSYPYEWPFGMLRDAALFHLELVEIALEENMTLRDCSPFNIQWVGSRPVFIDIPSFGRWAPGDPWAGYQQFCRMFLYPLMLEAYRGVPFQRWLRANLEGIPAEEMSRLFRWQDLWRPGMLLDVFLQAHLERRWAPSRRRVRQEMRESGFQKEFILRNVRRLRRIVEGLRHPPARGVWANYATERNYDREEYERKSAFVKKACEESRRELVWDLGCNTGDFSRIAAPRAKAVVAMDADPGVVQTLYGALRGDEDRTVIPLVMNLADCSPSQGWWGLERKSLWARTKPDLVLALALLHHLVISAHVPLPEVVSWLASLEADLVIEFVDKKDAMVQRLLLNKDDIYTDYERDRFETLLAERFDVADRLSLQGGNRWIYRAVPKKPR